MGAMRFIEGSVRVRVRGKYPERVINILANNAIDFSDLTRREDGAQDFTVKIGAWRRLRELSRETGLFTVRVIYKSGAPWFLWSLRGRTALFIGLGVSLALVFLSSLFVWQIEIYGNETVPDAQILAALRDCGVKPGSFVFSIDNELVQDRILSELSDLAWIGVNVRGSRAWVLCRETRKVPQIRDFSEPRTIIAQKDGIIESITVVRGRAAVSPGDAVRRGDVLAEPNGAGGRIRPGADAAISARTRYELSASAPVSGYEKAYTGRSETRLAVIFGEKRIKFYFSGRNLYPSYDKIYDEKRLALPGGSALPITVVRERYVERELISSPEDVEAVRRLVEARLLERLYREIGDGTVLETEFTAAEEDGVLTVTLRAECREDIGEGS